MFDTGPDEVEQELTELQQEPEITLHALTGWTTSKTMRVAAKVGQHDIVVLIDTGSTHKKIANLLQLPVVPTEPFDVRVANGSPLKCKGRFDHVQILLQGTVVCNWKKITMEFQWQNQFQKLQGIYTTYSSCIIDSHFKRSKAREFHVCCLPIAIGGSCITRLPPRYATIIGSF
ncbi:hypothetical protein Pint_26935 [Pistacia integerrima]|uniref:Uncharacterized protein n=1 Tax=Pistacia integerrima TaxID=434235 RepID=A0ACC0YTP1_9ROSI|nr:hypothetical protein Pint_26935 [Pistacia integerrima]